MLGVPNPQVPMRFLLGLSALLMFALGTACAPPRVSPEPWDAKDGVLRGRGVSLPYAIRYFNAQAGWPPLSQADQGYVGKRKLPGEVESWEFNWDHTKGEFKLYVTVVPPGGSKPVDLSATASIGYSQYSSARKATTWHAYGHPPLGAIYWSDNGEVTVTSDAVDGWMVTFYPQGPPRARKAYLGFPEDEFLGIASVEGVAPVDKAGLLEVRATLRSGASFGGRARIEGDRLVPHGRGIFSFPKSNDFLMALFEDGRPYRGAFGSMLSGDIVYKVNLVDHFKVWHAAVAGSRIGTSILADVWIGSDRVIYRDGVHELVRVADGSFYFQDNDRSGQFAAYQQEQRERSAANLALKTSGSSGKRAFQLFPDQVPDTHCSRCKGSGFTYEWSSTRQEKVWSTANGHTDGAWQDATVHRSGGLVTCSRCQGSGKR